MGEQLSFLYQKDPTFLKGLEELRQSDSTLADYIKEVRNWSYQLTEVRNNLEHHEWQLDDVVYSNNSGKIEVIFPTILSRSIEEFIDLIIDRLSSLIEDVVVYSLQNKMSEQISFLEIPLIERDKAMPVRFRVGLIIDGIKKWRISYNQIKFSDR